MVEFRISRAQDLQESLRGIATMFNTNRAVWALIGMAAGAAFAAVLVWPARGRRPTRADDQSSRVDEASEDSFPASDPPSFSVERGAQTGG